MAKKYGRGWTEERDIKSVIYTTQSVYSKRCYKQISYLRIFQMGT